MTWLYLYERAAELSAEAIRDADRVRLARQARRLPGPTLLARLRRAGALAAALIARRLDECPRGLPSQRRRPGLRGGPLTRDPSPGIKLPRLHGSGAFERARTMRLSK